MAVWILEAKYSYIRRSAISGEGGVVTVFHRGCYALCAGPHCWAQRIKLLAGLSTLIFLLHQQKIIPPAPPYPPAHHTITIISVREKELFFNLFHLVFEVMFNPVNPVTLNWLLQARLDLNLHDSYKISLYVYLR